MDHNSNKDPLSPHMQFCFDERIFQISNIGNIKRFELKPTKAKSADHQHIDIVKNASQQSHSSEVVSQPLFPETAEQSTAKSNRINYKGKENGKRCKNSICANEFLKEQQSENINDVNANYKKSSRFSKSKFTPRRNLHNTNANINQPASISAYTKILLKTSDNKIIHDICPSSQEELKSMEISQKGKICTNKTKTIKRGGNKSSHEYFDDQSQQVSSYKEPVSEINESDVSFIEPTPTETRENSFIMKKLTSFSCAKMNQIDEKWSAPVIFKDNEKLCNKTNVMVSNKDTKSSVEENNYKEVDFKRDTTTIPYGRNWEKVIAHKFLNEEQLSKEFTENESENYKQSEEKSQSNNAASQLKENIMQIWSQEPVEINVYPENLPLIERLKILQKWRDVGLYVNCDNCKKYRYLDNIKDPLDLPEQWFCYMHPDKNYNNCQLEEKKIPAFIEVELICNKYNAGSIVWGKIEGYPWWPAMVDDDPNVEAYYWLESYSDVPTFYHVVFFDCKEPTRAWLKLNAIQNFVGNEHLKESSSIYEAQLNYAFETAQIAATLPLLQRLETYSFLSLCTDKIKEFEDENAPCTKKKFITNVEESGKKNTKKRKCMKDNKNTVESNVKINKTDSKKQRGK